MSRFSCPGALSFGPVAQQFMVGAVRKSSLNIFSSIGHFLLFQYSNIDILVFYVSEDKYHIVMFDIDM